MSPVAWGGFGNLGEISSALFGFADDLHKFETGEELIAAAEPFIDSGSHSDIHTS